AFNTLKQALISEPILQYPDFNKTFYLMTDGSAKGYGAVLSQLDEKGKERVIAYASKSTVGAQKNYSATELEIGAALWAMEYFNYYLGYNHFELWTDHSAMTYIKNNKVDELKGRIARWALKIQQYDFTIKYRAGKKNANADALSRL